MIDYANLPQFIWADAAGILGAWKTAYTNIIGRPLMPMQTESILLQVMAAREKILRDDFNAGARSQLIDFSQGPMLDYLVALLNVKRLAAQFASCTLLFTVGDTAIDVTIPAGFLVASTDGKVTFSVTTTTFIAANTVSTVEVNAVCSAIGTIGNGYAINTIIYTLAPLPGLAVVANVDITGGGSDVETDGQLVSRAKLAPDKFSTAGPKNAYKYWAKTAHPSIVDVAVLGAQDDGYGFLPGTVHIFPLVVGAGTTSTPVLDAVLATCNGDDIMPLNDLVYCASPTGVDFDLEVNLTPFAVGTNDTEIESSITAFLTTYTEMLKQGLNIDAIVAKIESICMTSDMYDVDVVSPSANVTTQKNQYANCTSITVNIVGHHG